MKSYIFFSLLGIIVPILSTPLYSQGLPDTEIFLTELTIENGSVTFGELKNITNRAGYDNQPSFSRDGKSILFTSIRDSVQADIYRYDIERDSTVRVTTTEESEYSPTVTPDGEHFSVVRVEKDSTQRLWKFSLDGTNPGLVFRTIKPVGYHCWLDSHWVALFILGEPNMLMFVDSRTEKASVIANNIGRSLHVIPGENTLSYVEKISDSVWLIKGFNFNMKNSVTVAQTIQGSEDFYWLPDGSLFMGSGSALFRFSIEDDPAWRQIADFSDEGLRSITRLSVSPDGTRLAIVAVKEKK